VSEKRTWNSPIREPWNPVIRNILQAIDTHNQLYFKTGKPWHLQKAQELRGYVIELKEWIASNE
jgi:hypothetical protein